MPKLRKLIRKPITWLYVAGVLILLGAGVFWCLKQCSTPEHVFWGMVEQSLRTKGVTIQADQDNPESKMSQSMQYSLGGTNISHTYNILEQGKTKVVTELIGTPKANYNRYVSVETDEKDSEGKPLDLSRVRKVWAESKVDAKDPQAAQSFLSQSIFGFGTPIGGSPVPIGNLSADARQKLIAQMKQLKVYSTKYAAVKKQKVGGRLQYVYEVNMPTDAYVTIMKSFAKSMGLHDLDTLDPSQYKQAAPLKLLFSVDVHARHLVKVSFVEDKKTAQIYTGYDVAVSATAPKKTITGEELQKRLSELR